MAKEAEQAEKEQEKVSNWVRDLLDQRVDLRVEIRSMELELEQLKEDRDRMQREISGLGGVSTGCSLQCFREVSGCFSWAKGTQKENG